MDVIKKIPTLHIEQFEQGLTDDFYSNDFDNHLAQNNNIIHKPHKHDFFLCMLFTSGSGIHEIDFNTYPIERGSVFMLKPGQTHHWRFDKSPRGYIFFHTKDFYEQYFLNKGISQFPFYFTQENPPHLLVNDKYLDKLVSLFKEITMEYRDDDLYKFQKLNSLVNLVYINLARRYIDRNPNKIQVSKIYLQILENFQDFLEDFFKTEKSPKFYADKLNITTKHLNRVTKTILDKTCSSIIKERVLLEAKRLLVHSNNSLSSIAEQLGFDEYSYFSKVFKTNTGITPFEFRKKY